MEEVFIEEEQQGEGIMTLFPMLEKLELCGLPQLRHFFLMECDLESVNTDDEVNADGLNKAMFNSKVSCPNLEVLLITAADSINALWSHQLPTAYLSKLETLEVEGCEKLRNLMSPSVARRLLNLQKLVITECKSIEEVITEDEQQGEGIMTVFPLLEKLKLWHLPKLRHFFLTERALKFPFLREVWIENSPKMKTFVQQGICGSLESMDNDDVEVTVDDLNKWIQERFNYKEKKASDDGNEAEPSYGRS